MLKKGRVIFWFIFLCTILSCEKTKDNTSDILHGYVNDNFKNYRDIYNMSNDSILKWVTDSLENIGSCCFYNPFRLDSALCFNSDRSFFVSTLNKSSIKWRDGQVDLIQIFCGAQINIKWYFFLGGTYVISHNSYQDSVYSHFTFEELSYIAHQEILSDAIIKNPDGTFSSNEIFFKHYFDKSRWAADSCTTQASFDSLIVYRAGEKYKHKLKKDEIDEIKQKMNNSVRPPEPSGLWLRKLFSTKLFH